MPDPVRFSPELEQVNPGEQETIAQIEAQLDHIQTTVAGHSDHAYRAAHAKGHAIVRGTLTVAPDLPSDLAQGLFAQAGAHDALFRLSTNAGDLLDDSIGLPRGLALKVFGVAGERLPGLPDATTQDFILVNGPEFTSPDAHEFLKGLKQLAPTADKAPGLKKAWSFVAQKVEGALETVGMDSPRLHQMGGAPNVHPLGETYYTKTAYRFGDHIAKLALFPVSPALTALTNTLVKTTGHPTALRAAVDEVLAREGGRWELRAQLCTDLDAMPIDDPTVHWDERLSAYRVVATFDAPPQRSWIQGESGAAEDRLTFNIWNGLAAHRPLGSINRARRDTYVRSARFRHERNGCPMQEPHAPADVLPERDAGRTVTPL